MGYDDGTATLLTFFIGAHIIVVAGLIAIWTEPLRERLRKWWRS